MELYGRIDTERKVIYFSSNDIAGYAGYTPRHVTFVLPREFLCDAYKRCNRIGSPRRKGCRHTGVFKLTEFSTTALKKRFIVPRSRVL